MHFPQRSKSVKFCLNHEAGAEEVDGLRWVLSCATDVGNENAVQQLEDDEISLDLMTLQSAREYEYEAFARDTLTLSTASVTDSRLCESTKNSFVQSSNSHRRPGFEDDERTYVQKHIFLSHTFQIVLSDDCNVS